MLDTRVEMSVLSLSSTGLICSSLCFSCRPVLDQRCVAKQGDTRVKMQKLKTKENVEMDKYKKRTCTCESEEVRDAPGSACVPFRAGIGTNLSSSARVQHFVCSFSGTRCCFRASSDTGVSHITKFVQCKLGAQSRGLNFTYYWPKGE